MSDSSTRGFTDRARTLLDAPEFATVATLEPDGQPQLSVVWVLRDGDDVLFSTVRGRRKTTNLERDARASLVVFGRDDPYAYLEIRGTTTIEPDADGALIEALSLAYRGRPFAGHRAGDERVVVRLTPSYVRWYQ